MVKLIRLLLNAFNRVYVKALFHYYSMLFSKKTNLKINLGSGTQVIPSYLACDIFRGAEVRIDLSCGKLPFNNNSAETILCTSVVNYLSYKDGAALIREIHRALKPDGICRMSVQDLDLLIKYYHERNTDFFSQKNKDGSDRFPGRTIADKFNNWFFGFASNGISCKYIYNYDSLKLLFLDAGFQKVELKKFLESKISNIELIDNREDQMFFLEAQK